ncbi:zinc finger protein 578 [Pieris rapae]|uniref:zinc finger protein 578 n=1 Tax=Pieris rapae TaxID=64459 RepID=UPI001E27B4E3|nr:zinc finger protein 578 [Pieris rapae]
MENLKVCRLCLTTDIKLNVIHSTSLEYYYELLTGTDPLYEYKMPTYACHLCVALLRKYFLFRQKCLEVQSMLQRIVIEKGQVTIADITQIQKNHIHNMGITHHVINIDIDINSATYDTKSAEKMKNEINHEKVAVFMFSEDDWDIKREAAKTPIKNEIFIRNNLSITDIEDIKVETSRPLGMDIQKHDNLEIKNYGQTKIKLNLSYDSLKGTESSDDDQKLVNLINKSKVKTKSIIGLRRKERAQRIKQTKKNTPTIHDKDLEEFVIFIYLTKEEQLEELRKRRESEEFRQSQHKCDKCCKTFLNERSALNHAVKHDESRGSLECDICKLRFKTRRKFSQHYSMHPRRYVCRNCPRVLSSLYQARLHVRYHQGVKYKCPHCEEVHVNKSTYLNHLRSKHPADFTCELCGAAFVTQHGLNRHKKAKHRNENSSDADARRCELCNIQFANAKAYERHKITSQKHANITNQFSCLECGEVFSTNDDRRDHARLKHKRDLKLGPDDCTWPIQCPHCPEKIPNAMANWSHYRERHPDKKYPVRDHHVCQYCGKGFATKAGLESHNASHSNEYAHKCSVCGKGFRHRDGMMKHQKSVHSDTRPHMCSLCGRTFKLNSALVKHQRTHTGERPFKCEECGKSFGFSTTRNIHYQTVHLKLPNPYDRSRKKKLAETIK